MHWRMMPDGAASKNMARWDRYQKCPLLLARSRGR
jgi:hypothetical protein